MRTIASCITSQQDRTGQDNFLLLRFIASCMVIFGHSWALGFNPAGELDWLTRYTLLFSGTHAVQIFFFVSGFLVTMSYERRHSFWAFAKARSLRIFPALVVCVALTSVVLGPLVSELPAGAYFHNPLWRSYLFGNVSLTDIQYKLPGVFAHNRYADVVNGSLWTIPGEMQMYFYVAALGVLGLLRSRLRFGLAIGVLVTLAVFGPAQLRLLSQQDFYGLAVFFILGAFCWMYRQHVVVNGYVLMMLLLACALFYQKPGYFWVLGAATVYGCIWFVYVPRLQWFNRFGDYSYGLYLYGFVIQQLLASVLPQLAPFSLFAMSFPLILGIAMASWHLIEKPALRFK